MQSKGVKKVISEFGHYYRTALKSSQSCEEGVTLEKDPIDWKREELNLSQKENQDHLFGAPFISVQHLKVCDKMSLHLIQQCLLCFDILLCGSLRHCHSAYYTCCDTNWCVDALTD